jgi:hypothetical protein
MHPPSGAASVGNGADYYKWDSPSGDLSVFLRLELVDGVLSDVMSAFGALPRRGAETGGILLGRVESGAVTVVRVDGFEHVPCSHFRGPSYMLSESEAAALETTAGKHSGAENGMAAVGYYRSHTRDGEAVTEEDRAILARLLPPPNGVMLVIRPNASRSSTAGFLTYSEGKLPDWPAKQFPFRRRELDGSRAAGRSPNDAAAALPALPEPPPAPAVTPREFSFAGYALPASKGRFKRRSAIRESIRSPMLAGFAAFLFGVIAGILGRPLIRSLNPPDQDPFVLSLAAKRSDGKLLINWDRDAPAVRYAQSGILQINDGRFSKTLELSANELQTGSVVFHSASEHVSLRLEIVVHQLTKVADATDWVYVPPR